MKLPLLPIIYLKKKNFQELLSFFFSLLINMKNDLLVSHFQAKTGLRNWVNVLFQKKGNFIMLVGHQFTCSFKEQL